MLAALGSAACHRAAPPSFDLLRTSPVLAAEGEPLLLNDTITVYFSAPPAALSVTPDSFSVLDARGNQVPGSLRVGGTWVTFTPDPPVSPSLADGSFVPGESYQLRIAGYPRPDAVRAVDGTRLSVGCVLPFVAATREHRPPGLPAPLRPVSPDLPLVLRAVETPVALPVDSPTLRLHFSLPLLPTSVTAAAFEIRALRDRDLPTLVPRRVRAVLVASDAYPGSTVEIDLGSVPLREDGGTLALRPGDLISVSLRAGSAALQDYQGNEVLPAPPQFWTAVAGASVALLELPGGTTSYAPDTGLDPGFEVRDGVIRPQVRIEAGDGSLGIWRPQRDVLLVPGEAFDRGDGVLLRGRGSVFPFQSIEVPKGVKVTLDARRAPVHLLALGSIRIDGELELLGGVAALDDRQFAPVPVASFFDLGTTVLLAAGDVHLAGRVHTSDAIAADATALVVASAGHVRLGGELPFRTLLALESSLLRSSRPAVLGPRGQTLLRSVAFTYGLAPGAACRAEGCSSWLQVPSGHELATVRLLDADPEVKVAWQATPADAIRADMPDLTVGRTGRWQPLSNGESLGLAARAFVRFSFTSQLVAGQVMPQLRELRLVAP